MDSPASGRAPALVEIPASVVRPRGFVEQPPKAGCKQIRDLSGDKIGALTIVGFAGYIWQGPAWLCRCTCGALSIRDSSHFRALYRCKTCSVCRSTEDASRVIFVRIDDETYQRVDAESKGAHISINRFCKTAIRSALRSEAP